MMYSRSKILKSLFCIFLIFIVNTVSFAAIVSDNDGSAFVTKAEFEALKNNFNKQISDYSRSIDGKIDGAIASYLAGIQLSSEVTLANAVSKIEYPLYIYMKDPTLTLTDWDTNGATPYWAPSWYIYLWGQRFNACFVCEKDMTVSKQIDWFYNGKWDTTLNKFKITDMITGVTGKASLVSKFYQFQDIWGNENYVSFGFTADQDSTYARTSRGTNWVTRDKVRPSGRSLVTFAQESIVNPNLIIDAVWAWGSSNACTMGSSSANNEHYLNQFKASSNGWSEGNNPSSIFLSPTLDFTSKGITKIYNANDATNKRNEVPVAYENSIYLTNKNNFKKDLLNGSMTNCKGYNASSKGAPGVEDPKAFTTVWRFGNFITPGWTLEPQFSTLTDASGNKHAKNKKSLMEPGDVYYETTTPYTNTKLNQTMTDGILLTETEDKLKSLMVDFDVTNSDITKDKYICFSKNPIGEINYNNVSGDTYLNIADNKNMTGAAKKIKLVSGHNIIFMDNLEKHDKIYYKILWDTTNTSNIKINSAPVINGTKED